MSSPEPLAEGNKDTIQVGRQAIFDRDLMVYAYELLYRNAGGTSAFDDGDQASSVTLLNAFLEIGLDRLVGPHKAFINLTRHFFVAQPTIPFPADRVVLEILEDIEVDERLTSGIEQMTAQGFELALDDYAFQHQFAPILPQVQYIKVEVTPDNLDQLAARMPQLRATGARLLAEKVETAEQFDQLRAMGFDYFQGYFFARPNLVRSDRLKENTAMVMQLLARLNDPAVTMKEVVYLVSQDTSLSFKILRFINSAAVGLRSKVDSIQRAVVLMGLARIRAWASLFAMARLDGRPAELFNVALLRANLCEHLCRLCDQGDPDTAYTIGLLSVVDAMMDRPMAELLKELQVSDESRSALLNGAGYYGSLLRQAKQLEHNQRLEESCTGVAANQMVEAFAASSEAAFAALSALDRD